MYCASSISQSGYYAIRSVVSSEGGCGKMNAKRRKPTLIRAFVALFAIFGVMLCASPALAENLVVSGADSFIAEGKKEMDLLTVTGPEGKTVYINMARTGDKPQTVASHLAFTLTDQNGSRDANGDVVGVVSVESGAGAFDPEGTYTIEVFSDREEKEQNKIYGGTVSCLYAQYGTDEPEPLVLRTLAERENRPLDVPQTQTKGGVSYKLVSAEPKVVDGKTVYAYEESTNIADSVDAHVSFYASGNETPIKVETRKLAKGESQQVEIPSIVSDDKGNMYRTLQLTNSATLSYPGVTEQSVMCKQLSGEWGSPGSFYEATIKYVNTNGKDLGVVDTVIVNKAYTYTAPTYLYVDEGDAVREYKIVDQSKAVLKLEPGQAQGKEEYQIVYDVVPDDAERTWTVVIENGSVAPTDKGRVIERKTYKGKPGRKAVHNTQQKIKVDGVDYVPTNTTQKSYEHTFGVAEMGVEQTIYYVPDGYVVPEAYDVTVKYVNIATNEVIDTQAYTASPNMRQDLEITSPETFSMGGVEWIRLNGQEKAIRHSYYSTPREYVVYYRDVNDDLHANTVIRTVRVVYVDEEGNTVTRPTTIVDNGTTDGGTTGGATGDGTTAATDAATADGTTAAAPAAAATTTDTGLQTGADLRSVQGDDGSALVTEGGTDLATTRIDDDQTPLAGPQSDEAASKANTLVVGAVAGGIGIAAAIGLVLFFVFKRRKKDEGDSSDGDATA